MLTHCSSNAALPDAKNARITTNALDRGSAMQALIELIAGFVALLAAAALSQFGLDLTTPQENQREIHRIRDCGGEKAAPAALAARGEGKREC